MNSPGGKEQAQVEIGIFTGKKKKKKGGRKRRLINADHCELAQRVGTKQERQGQKKKGRNAQVRSVNVSTRGCTHTWAGEHTKHRETFS